MEYNAGVPAIHATFLAMKLLPVAIVLAVATLGAQETAPPRLSPHETHSFEVDGAKITITYGRPSMRGRKIFGALVRFDRVWMPGADEATIFETSAPLRFGKVLLPAGSYSLYTLPQEKQWTLIINKMTGQYHLVYPADQDFAHLDMTIEQLQSPVERLAISAVPRREGGAVQLEWEQTRVSVPFVVVR